MNLEYWDELSARCDRAYAQIPKLPPYATQDCRKMGKAVLELLTKADTEKINCRRLHRVTVKFEELMNQAEQALHNFEAHVVFAQLLKKDNQ